MEKIKSRHLTSQKERDDNVEHKLDGTLIECRKEGEAPPTNYDELIELTISLFKWAIGI